ncbi:tcdB toxin N-terminal helical domain protein, partial [Escherichia coli 90.0091]
TIKVLTG